MNTFQTQPAYNSYSNPVTKYVSGTPKVGDYTMGGSSGGLMNNIGDYMSDPKTLGGIGDLLGGIGGLYQGYLAGQQLDDIKKTNSLYRSVMGQQQNQHTDFLNSANNAFGQGTASGPQQTNYKRHSEIG